MTTHVTTTEQQPSDEDKARMDIVFQDTEAAYRRWVEATYPPPMHIGGGFNAETPLTRTAWHCAVSELSLEKQLAQQRVALLEEERKAMAAQVVSLRAQVVLLAEARDAALRGQEIERFQRRAAADQHAKENFDSWASTPLVRRVRAVGDVTPPIPGLKAITVERGGDELVDADWGLRVLSRSCGTITNAWADAKDAAVRELVVEFADDFPLPAPGDEVLLVPPEEEKDDGES